jgi:glutamate dehydrogenase
MTVGNGLMQAFLAAEPEALDNDAVVAFLNQVVEDYRPEELPGVPDVDLGHVLASFWAFACSAPTDGVSARLIAANGADGHPLGSDVLEIVQPDAPFLVDTVMGELGDTGLHIRAMFHPLAQVRETRRSMIQVWLEPLSEARRDAVVDSILSALADSAVAVRDHSAMRALMTRSIADLTAARPKQPSWAEEISFLQWVDDEHFVYLGARIYEYPRGPDGEYSAEEPLYRAEEGLGVLCDPARRVLRRGSEPAILSAAMRREFETAGPVIVAKSNLRSRVHRRAYMDYIGVHRFGEDGKPAGEVRFVGLFTMQAYNQPTCEIPLLRCKVEHVLARAAFPKHSHNAARLSNIVETFPRDELFQIGDDELLKTALDILHLFDRPKVKLFVRADSFDRFVSALVYVPRDRYDSRLRILAGELLAKAYGGRVSAYYPTFSDSPLARVQFIIGLTPGDHLHPDIATIEARIAKAARTWIDDFETVVRADIHDQGEATSLLASYADAFPPGYRDHYDAQEGYRDLSLINTLRLNDDIAVRAFRRETDTPLQFRLKLYRKGDEPARLARVTPILADMGLSALVEEGYPITPTVPGGAQTCVWVHEFLLEDENGAHITFGDIRSSFESAFSAVWDGQAESDGFNRLVLELGASWREAALVRALCRFRLQSGLDPSPTIQQSALAAYPQITRLILGLFAARFDPGLGATMTSRREQADHLGAAIEEALKAVAGIDDDRVLRRLAALVQAITRTNYYQRDITGELKPYMSFKIASRELVDLPSPKPYREIFVAGPIVEGVHLRMGPVARGGLRWSDRRDDFRTEVLGLVKAQQVKNAVIVPVGSKGGFFPKRLPRGGSADAIRAEAIVAYKIFLNGLLDLTDNLLADGSVAHPDAVLSYDAVDPYLVVAADKGTATFSDIANSVARDYGFWLDDAFASGGSAGYDHKAMAITARGAWEGVKRHFRELGKDVQRDSITVVGVGDMSGDVFGNGMLLSTTLKLRAAFDHRDVFLDPEPNPAVSWQERKRLFDLPRSSWQDYNGALISPGGGVWSRTLKSVPLTPEVRALLDVKAHELSPDELISAILRSRTELLYLGGIGTYVKAATETSADVGDKANDAVRVDGRDLRCLVVGEGANLGFTQAARIEYALAGGRIDTDAIDNSAGVDTSDHEVNIKILTGLAIRAGSLRAADRDPLLASMTDEVATHVLAHNYDQSLILSLLQSQAARDLEAHAAFMTALEKSGRLNRALEGLPDVEEIKRRSASGLGLTRPELAVLLAYGKIDLFADIMGSAAPDDTALAATLRDYFPKGLGRFREEMAKHPLRREIIATTTGNTIVNLCGPTFPARLRDAVGCDTRALVAAFEAARQILDIEANWKSVERLDGRAPTSAQAALFSELSLGLRGMTYWLARRAMRESLSVKTLVTAYQPAVDTLRKLIPGVLSPFERRAAVRRAAIWTKLGAPKALSHSIALMRPLTLSPTLTDLLDGLDWPIENAAFVYHRIGGVFGFDRLRAAAGSDESRDPYERLAKRRLVEDMLSEQAALTCAVMSYVGAPQALDRPEREVTAVTAWSAAHAEPIRKVRAAIEDIEKSGGVWTLAKLTIANATLRELTAL